MNFTLFKMSNGKIRKNTAGGFTLVETLVAITVLMIAIAGPLVVASKGLTAALYARDQMIGTFLAQESMEVIKNTRDNNLTSGSGWLAVGAANMVSCTSASNSSCDASAYDAVIKFNCPPTSLTGQSASSACNIYSTPSGYSDNGSLPNASLTQFYRHFYLTPVTGNVNEYTVHVIVDWNEGTVPYQIDLSSELVNASR